MKKFAGIFLFLISIAGCYAIYKMYNRWIEVKLYGNKGSEYESGYGVGILIMAFIVALVMIIGFRLATPFSKKK
nr:hypothetical protein [Bacteroidota bacterium]